MAARVDVLVIGAGPAGLAAAVALKGEGIEARIVDRADAVGSSWRAHYDRLRLHTHRRFSGLPSLPIPRAFGPWVARADFVRYLEAYARRFELAPRLGVTVEQVQAADGGFAVTTSQGDLLARAVVVASGYNHTPWLPTWPGQFAGELLHASRYRTPEPYAGKRVLVIGSGNTGAEIAVDLAEKGTRSVLLAVRTPPNVLRRSILGIPSQALALVLSRLPVRVADAIARAAQRLTQPNLTRFGLPPPPRGVFTSVLRDKQIPILDMGFLAAVRSQRVRIVPEVVGFEGSQVICRDQRVEADVVIAATGYRRGLESFLGGLPVLDERGNPKAQGAADGPAPGLYFIGYRNPITGNLYSVAKDAVAVAKRIARSLSAR